MNTLLPASFRESHRQIILAYLQRGHEFRRAEWREAISAFDLLKNGVVWTDDGIKPFPILYRQYVEMPYANLFLTVLYEAENISQAGTRFWAKIAGKISVTLSQAGLYQPNQPDTRFLLAYCLYWWRSFTLGYILEVEVQRDLKNAGIHFKTHDLLNPKERLSPYDIEVLGFKGDIKNSTYFLQAVRTRHLTHDFYITKIQGKQRNRMMVVFIQQNMWHMINGDTLLTLLENLADVLPQMTHIKHEGIDVVVIDYELWKQKLLRKQGN